ncbi:heat shock protein 70 [Neoconidiobolus thromboides FSU 785]|nr:heat shock protein 70 [Neoconidiobolus thromboides FSU 785]
MSVVGIDLGNLSSYIAVARNRGIDVITNEVSNRDTPSLVSFGTKQRYIGESAKTQEVSNFKNTVGSLKRIIGRSFNDPEIEVEKRFINAELVDVDGQVGVKVNFKGEPTTFTATQLMGMYLGKLRDTAANELKLPCSDVVVSVPGWFNDRQRRALLDACQIANLNCLRIMNEITASALGYGITKTDLPETEPRNVIIVDVGHSSYSVAAVSYIKGQLNVKATAYDNKVGGRYIDELLVNHFAQVFKEKYKIDILSNPKATFRLRTGVEKLKKVLSANSQAPLNIESIMEDRDVSALMKREEFEELIQDQLERLAKPLSDVIAEVGWGTDQIYSVEIVGGTSRIPTVKEKISSLLGKELSFTLNQDEAVSRGCALQCAILSPVFKVRDFSVTDILNFPVKFTWTSTEGGADSEVDVFSFKNPVPSSKILTFYRKEPFEFQANYSNPKKLPAGTNPWIGTFSVKNVTSLKDGELSTVKVKARVNLHGVINVESAHIAEEIIQTEEPAEGDNPEDPPKTKKVIKKHDLPVVSQTNSLDENILGRYKEVENDMYASDKLVTDTEHAKNALEEYVYDTRSKLSGAYSSYIDPTIKDSFIASLNEVEDWLYGDGEDTTKSVYVSKIEELNQIGAPVIARYRESSQRPFAAENLKKEIERYRNLAIGGDVKYDHIAPEELEKIVNKCNELEKWLKTELATIESLPKYETPKVTSAQIKQSQDQLQYLANPILSKPKPAPKVEEPKPASGEQSPEKATEEPKQEQDDMDID